MVAMDVGDEAVVGGGERFEGVDGAGGSGEGSEVEGHFAEVGADVEDGHSGLDAIFKEKVEVMIVVAMDEDVAVEVEVMGEEQLVSPAVAAPVRVGNRIGTPAEGIVKAAGADAAN